MGVFVARARYITDRTDQGLPFDAMRSHAAPKQFVGGQVRGFVAQDVALPGLVGQPSRALPRLSAGSFEGVEFDSDDRAVV